MREGKMSESPGDRFRRIIKTWEEEQQTQRSVLAMRAAELSGAAQLSPSSQTSAELTRQLPTPRVRPTARSGRRYDTVIFVLSRVVLFIAVLLAVNAVSYLLTNFLALRGPMAYGYIPDTKVRLADVFASYPD
jgi:hypothetical protein